MKTILLIDQPVNNRGDEAAHKSLLRKISKDYPEYKIICLLRSINPNTIVQMCVDNENIEYVNLPNEKGFRQIREFLCSKKLESIGSFFHFNRQLDSYIKKSDLVLVSPGGMNLGGFKTWNHLYIVRRCKALHKPVIYYSRSIGPFNYETNKDALFSELSIEFLQNVDFLSIRDSKSCSIAAENHIKHMVSIDTAFLDNPVANIPKSLKLPADGKFVVFVPNELKWHPNFRTIDKGILEEKYHLIINYICENTDYDIVMLPQLYNVLNRDFSYFSYLRVNSKYVNRIIVVEDVVSSDIQQKIISMATAVIGARYHSVVFAINNVIPFVSLSYEHKMNGLLEQLGLSAHSIPFATKEDIAKFNIKDVAKVLALKDKIQIESAKLKAHEIAVNTFNSAMSVAKIR